LEHFITKTWLTFTILIMIIILVITFMYGIYSYTLETNYVSRIQSATAVLHTAVTIIRIGEFIGSTIRLSACTVISPVKYVSDTSSTPILVAAN
jgi:hypothetical protein